MAELSPPLTRAALARKLKCGRSSITEMLGPEDAHARAKWERSGQSTLVPAVHKALGWDPPPPLVLAQDTQELLAIFESLSEKDRGAMLERARVMREQQERAKPETKPNKRT